MQNRLHQAVMDNPIVKEMKPFGLTSLQLAAREGICDLVIKLLDLNAGVDQTNEETHEEQLTVYAIRQARKTPLYLAVENGHSVVAQMLLAVGADINQAIDIANDLNDSTMANHLLSLESDPNTIFNLAFYAIKNLDDNILLTQLLNKLDEGNSNIDAMSALIEFAFQSDNLDAAKLLLKRLNSRSLRIAPGIFTAGFWIAKQINPDLDLLKQVCSKDKDWLTMLCQLKAMNINIAANCLRAAPPAVKKEFLAIKQLEVQAEHADLTPEQNAAYSGLAAGSSYELGLYCEASEDFRKILEVAYQAKNLVVLDKLFSALSPESLTEVFIETNDYAINQFLFFCQKKNLAGWAFDSRNNPQLLSTITENFVTRHGLLHSLVSQNTKLNEAPHKSIVEFVNEIKPDTDTLTLVLQRCIQNHHPIATINIEREESKEEEYKRDPFSSILELPISLRDTASHFNANAFLTDALTPHDFSIVNICFNRFGVGVQQENLFKSKSKIPPFKDLPPQVWFNYILPNLDSKTLKALASVSHAMYEYKLQAAPHFNAEWNVNDGRVIEKERRQDLLIRFENNGEALDRLSRAIQKELDGKSFWDGREGIVSTLFYLTIYFMGIALESYWLYHNVYELDKYEADLRTLITHTGRSCYSSYACDRKYAYPECVPLCDNMDGMLNPLMFSLVVLMTQLVFIPVLPDLLNFEVFKDMSRFDSLTPLNLSEEVRAELKEAKSSQPDPIQFIHENSKLKFIRFELDRTREGYKGNADRIKAQIAAEAKHEAIEREHEEEIVRLARGEAKANLRDEEKSASKSAKLMTALGHFSPAKAVSGIASLFRSAPAIAFDAADRGLLHDEYNEMKYSNSEDEDVVDDGSYQPPRFDNSMVSSSAFFRQAADQGPSQSSSSRKFKRDDSIALVVELVSSSTKKQPPSETDIVIDITSSQGSKSKMGR